ncbi:MAG TPA: hypothetical protein VK766_01590 [Cytophagaceae bacterium]|jgi:hypothetical protein|nr:hypothetical protein [Cytophagaceae bacterium]
MEPNYEFNDKQNSELRHLYVTMRFVGATFVLVGTLLGLIILAQRIGVLDIVAQKVGVFGTHYHFGLIAIIFSVFLVITGVFLIKAARSFKKIVDTQGNDISLLMESIHALHLAFNIQSWMIIIGFFFLVISLIFLREISLF